jgi:hypothetical protein
MSTRVILGLLAAVAVFGGATPAVDAQEAVAQVQTWDGQSWTLREPTLEVFYTLVGPKPDESVGGPTAGGTQINLIGRSLAPRFSGAMGSIQAEARGLDSGSPDATQGRRQRQALTVVRRGSEIQVPLASVAQIRFSREPITESPLPPYVADDHFRYAAVIVLLDGSTVEADSVNLGTTILRGTSPQGRVDIPWREVEQLRLVR